VTAVDFGAMVRMSDVDFQPLAMKNLHDPRRFMGRCHDANLSDYGTNTSIRVPAEVRKSTGSRAATTPPAV
jgi:hypothetical protein